MTHRAGHPRSANADWFRPRRARRRHWAAITALGLAASVLAACGSEGKPELHWYVNPDGVDTFETYADKCSTDEYDISVEQLPSSATDQRVQLARRLAAEDSSTDLMNLDPVFVAEFASAGWLAEVPDAKAEEIKGSLEGEGNYLTGAAETVVWEDTVYAIPQWANTQVLWFRKSLAEAAGLDMSQPVTWQQVIDAAASQGGSVGVQANRYEGYVVWINALIEGAGGQIIENPEAGRDAEVTVDSDAGRAAARVIQSLADSEAAQPDLSVSNEGTVLGPMWAGPGEFMVNWTFVYAAYRDTVGQSGGPADEAAFEDLGWARYPATVEGEQSKPPIGGIHIGVGAYSENREFAQEAAECITSTEAQVDLAMNNGLMPSTKEAYEEVADSGEFPEDLIDLYRTSVDTGGPRPKSAFYPLISNALQETWHGPSSVDPDRTPENSAEFLEAVLKGEELL